MILFFQDLVTEKKFKEAGQLAEILNLQSEFADPEKILLPLILQNKTTIVEDFLRNQPELQKIFVIYLDDLLNPNKDLNERLFKFVK